jgi:hypothetical protein
MSHHEGNFIGDLDDHEHFHMDPNDYNMYHKTVMGYPIDNIQPDHYHTNDYEKLDIPNALPPHSSSFNKLSEGSTLRGEGVPAFTEPGYQDDQDQDDQVVGPQDLDSNATEVDKFPKSVGVFKNSSWKTAAPSEFGEPLDYDENRMQDVEDTSRLQSRFPLDTGKRPYSEQRQDANPLTLRSWFTGDDVNGPWPHTKNLSGPLDFEPTDDQNEDSTGPVMSSKLAHDDSHPWPQNAWELENHINSHHKPHNDKGNLVSGKTLIDHWGVEKTFDAHSVSHKAHDFKTKSISPHDHSDDFNIDVPDNIETIAPTYITSSWHQSTVDVFDTDPDEETPDSLTNPSDELKNGRPRSTDLPSQNAQFLPGMLVDHDPMGGSNFGST